jgi:hypothetical protein
LDTTNHRARLIVLAIGFALQALPADYYASPRGTGTKCTYASPCSLAAALGSASPASGGDTVWLRGGLYAGLFSASRSGLSRAAMLTYRNFPGERAILDHSGFGDGSKPGLVVRCSFCRFWGIELKSSEKLRLAATQGGSHPDAANIPFGEGIYMDNEPAARRESVEFINGYVYQTRQGFGWWLSCKNCLVDGTWFAYNGWSTHRNLKDRAHGFGLYCMNRDDPSSRVLSDSVLYNNAEGGLQAYGSANSYLSNLTLRGVIAFWNGQFSPNHDDDGGFAQNVLIGNNGPAGTPNQTRNITVENCYSYYPVDKGSSFRLGHGGSPIRDLQFRDNWLIGGTPIDFSAGAPPEGNVEIVRNSLYGTYLNHTATPKYDDFCSVFPGNSCWHAASAEAPGRNYVYVRPNRWEPGRFHVVVLNFLREPSVAVDLSGTGMRKGDAFEIFDLQNPFGCAGGAQTCDSPVPVAAGTFDGAPVRLPLTQTTAMAIECAAGCNPPSHTPSEFGAFWGRKKVYENAQASEIAETTAMVSASCPEPALGDPAADLIVNGVRYRMAGAGPAKTYTLTDLRPATTYDYQVVCGAAFRGSFQTKER